MFFGNFGTLPYLDQGAWSFGVGQRFLISTSIELSRLGIRTLWHGHGLAWITQCQSGSKGPCWRSPCCECHTHLEIKIDFEPYEMTTDTRILVYILKNDTKIAGSRYLIHVAQCHLILNRCIPPVQLPQSFGWADPSVFHLQRQRNPSSQLRFIQKGKLEDQKWTSGGPGRTGVSGECRKFTWLPWRALPYDPARWCALQRSSMRCPRCHGAVAQTLQVFRCCGHHGKMLGDVQRQEKNKDKDMQRHVWRHFFAICTCLYYVQICTFSILFLPGHPCSFLSARWQKRNFHKSAWGRRMANPAWRPQHQQ